MKLNALTVATTIALVTTAHVLPAHAGDVKIIHSFERMTVNGKVLNVVIGKNARAILSIGAVRGGQMLDSNRKQIVIAKDVVDRAEGSGAPSRLFIGSFDKNPTC